jgi:hypothetical protein
MRLPSLSAALLGALAWTARADDLDDNIRSISVCATAFLWLIVLSFFANVLHSLAQDAFLDPG